MIRPPPRSPLFPYTTLFRSVSGASAMAMEIVLPSGPGYSFRSEEHTSELQSPCNLVCRLLLEKKKINIRKTNHDVTKKSRVHPAWRPTSETKRSDRESFHCRHTVHFSYTCFFFFFFF